MSEPLTKVDSAVQGIDVKETKESKRKGSTSASGVMNINDLGEPLT
jgi:hypothetical protein